MAAYVRMLALYSHGGSGQKPGIWIRESTGWQAFAVQPSWSTTDDCRDIGSESTSGLIIVHSEDQQAFFHYNAGPETWSSKSCPVSGVMTGIFVLDVTHAWAVVGTNILAWDGTSWSVVQSGIATPASYAANRIWASSAIDVWVPTGAAGSGELWHFNGSSWVDRYSEISSIVNNSAPCAVWGTASNDVWVACDRNAGFGTDCGYLAAWNGSAWSQLGQTLGRGRTGLWGTGLTSIDDQSSRTFHSVFAIGCCGTGGSDVNVAGYDSNTGTWESTEGDGSSQDDVIFRLNIRGWPGSPRRFITSGGKNDSEGGGFSGQIWETDDWGHTWTRRTEANGKCWYGLSLWDDQKSIQPDEVVICSPATGTNVPRNVRVWSWSSLTENFAGERFTLNPFVTSAHSNWSILAVNEDQLWVGAISNASGIVKIWEVRGPAPHTWTEHQVNLSAWYTGIWRIECFHYISDNEILAVANPQSASVNFQLLKWNGSAWSRIAAGQPSYAYTNSGWGTEGHKNRGNTGAYVSGASASGRVAVSVISSSGVTNETTGNGLPTGPAFNPEHWYDGIDAEDDRANIYVCWNPFTGFSPADTFRIWKGSLGSWSVWRQVTNVAAGQNEAPGKLHVFGSVAGGDLEVLTGYGRIGTNDVVVDHYEEGVGWTQTVLFTGTTGSYNLMGLDDYWLSHNGTVDYRLYRRSTKAVSTPKLADSGTGGTLLAWKFWSSFLIETPDVDPPILSNEDPAPLEQNVSKTKPIEFDLTDDHSGLDDSLTVLRVNGTLVWQGNSAANGWLVTRTAVTNGWHFSLVPPVPYTTPVVVVGVYAEDQDGNVLDTSYRFYPSVDLTLTISIFAKRFIRVEFGHSIAATLQALEPSNYTLGDEISVQRVLYDASAPVLNHVDLFLSKTIHGQRYQLTVSNLQFAESGSYMGRTSIEFEAQTTKVDYMTARLGRIYDTAITSNMFQVLAAMGISDTTIGGELIQFTSSIAEEIEAEVEEEEEMQLPRLVWTDATTITISTAPGEPQPFRVRLQDGNFYTLSGLVTFDPSASGLGGLDTGSEAASTWYYLYLVPSGTNLNVVGSANDPDTGPVGYPNYRYISAVLNDSSSDLLRFHQVSNDEFHWDECESAMEPATIAALSKSALHTPAAAYDIGDTVPPVVASAVYVEAHIQRNSVGGWALFIELSVSGAIDTTTTTGYGDPRHFTVRAQTNLSNNYNSGSIICWLPLPPGTGHPEIGMKVDRDGGTVAPNNFFVRVAGWKDGYR